METVSEQLMPLKPMTHPAEVMQSAKSKFKRKTLISLESYSWSTWLVAREPKNVKVITRTGSRKVQKSTNHFWL